MALIALPLVAFTAACGDDDDDSTADESTATATEAGAPDVEVAAYPDDKRTGEASLDAVIDAVLAGNAADRLTTTRVTCDLAAAWGMGTPPACEPGEAAGTVIDALPVAGCEEDHYVRGAAIDELAQQIAANSPKLYAAYVPKVNVGSPSFPPGAFVGVFVNTKGEGFSAHVVDGDIVRVGLSCGTDFSKILSLAESELLPPLD